MPPFSLSGVLFWMIKKIILSPRTISKLDTLADVTDGDHFETSISGLSKYDHGYAQ